MDEAVAALLAAQLEAHYLRVIAQTHTRVDHQVRDHLQGVGPGKWRTHDPICHQINDNLGPPCP